MRAAHLRSHSIGNYARPQTEAPRTTLLVWWLNAPRSDAGLQESVSAAGFIGMFAVLLWQLWQGRREFR